MSTKRCADCKVTKPTEDFYGQRGHSQGMMAYCKGCFNARCQRRWVSRMLAAIRYKGSQCVDCCLHVANSHYAVFEFHYLNPEQKDADWSHLRLMSLAKIEAELDGCVLLCANCHRVRHALPHAEAEK